MRAVLSILGGFVLVLAVFGAGAAFSFTMFAPRPVGMPHPEGDSAVLWTAEPRKVDRNAVPLERIAAVARPDDAGPTVSEGVGIDRSVTASLSKRDASTSEGEQPAFSDAHVAWCESRFRSYDATTNSYRAYSGQRRVCVSPHHDEAAPTAGRALARFAGAVEADRPQMLMGYAGQGVGAVELSPEHVRTCFSRYRSYRPEDNTYQPWRGGPRQQCM